MRFVIFTHSLVSDWNHGNAHFLRGIAAELIARHHHVHILEPVDGWSRRQLLADAGPSAIADFEAAFPTLRSTLYNPATVDLDAHLSGADVVLVHEWNPPSLVARIGEHHRTHPSYRLLFHDTHHRSVTDPAAMSDYHLAHYDGVLAYGDRIARIYRARRWAEHVWTWHEAADVRTFFPRFAGPIEGDLVWIGNWGDDERSNELREFLIQPVQQLGLRARVYGVRYPDAARRELAAAGIEYAGWLPNHRVPETFARFRVTVHIPRRPYATSLPGIPTIRPFEALACGIPLVCAPWRDTGKLFRPGTDFLMAEDGPSMTRQLETLLATPTLRTSLAENGLETILRRHTCVRRVDQLLAIIENTTPAAVAQAVQGAY